jgi:aryl-alcohol dehydrogenase-like predicted oxidoreductase
VTIPARPLGSQGLVVSTEGLGCMGMSHSYGTPDDAESIATIHAAIDAGVTFLDTAEMYGMGANEELVGRAIAGRRAEVVIATKFGLRANPDGTRSIVGSPDVVRAACEGSLRRLGVDTIDLYYQHRVDPSVPVEETWGAMSELVAEGKVRYLGISEAAPDTIRRAHATHPMTAIQSEYSLWSRDIEDNDVLATVRELGIGFVAYSPLGRGFLAGTIRAYEDFAETDYRRHAPRFQGDNFAKNLAVVDRVGELAAEKGVTASQLALAWVLAQGSDIVPIPGTKRRTYLAENISALAIDLTPEDLASIEAVAPKGSAAGERYAAEHMAHVYR